MKRFAPIAHAMDYDVSTILDGEIVVVEDNRTNCSLLQADLASGRKDRMGSIFIRYPLHGCLRREHLIERKTLLENLCKKFRPPVFYSQHFDVDPDKLFESAKRMNLEGIISNKRNGLCKSDRTEDWIKLKCVQRARFPIVGFIPDVGGVAALYLAKQEGNELVYAGKVGSGFSHKTSMTVRNALVTLQQKLTSKVRKPKAKWVEPRLYVEVEYRDITADGLLRQSSFKG